ncbi:hypothetical protein [Sphingomonas crocodyli]|uniref:Uncharacterized protein n=1 Tax=Sphingomonas crocodyli TaxID=1979270 RepID=A0A437M116_9SPHN|nr:hypothetical protein [Sphingomonas crocodyli]RVT91292.1 hypothetical protein EOD43_17450 [Sphingomonas crocodyli]
MLQFTTSTQITDAYPDLIAEGVRARFAKVVWGDWPTDFCEAQREAFAQWERLRSRELATEEKAEGRRRRSPSIHKKQLRAARRKDAAAHGFVLTDVIGQA